MIAGVDGYSGRRWIAAIDQGGRRTAVVLIESFTAVLKRDDLSLIVIDVPIGLMKSGFRNCDMVARKLVGRRRSSIFPAPIRNMLDASDYADACKRRYDVERKKCSIQLFAILPVVREVDRLVTPQVQSRVREGHPEVSFALLNRGIPLSDSKKTSAGRAARLSLLEREFPDIHQQSASLGRADAAEDILDAYALLWSARRVRDGLAVSLPAVPQHDPRGLRVEIVA